MSCLGNNDKTKSLTVQYKHNHRRLKYTVHIINSFPFFLSPHLLSFNNLKENYGEFHCLKLCAIYASKICDPQLVKFEDGED